MRHIDGSLQRGTNTAAVQRVGWVAQLLQPSGLGGQLQASKPPTAPSFGTYKYILWHISAMTNNWNGETPCGEYIYIPTWYIYVHIFASTFSVHPRNIP